MVLNVFRKLIPVVFVIAWMGPCAGQVSADPPKAAPVVSPSPTSSTAGTATQESPAVSAAPVTTKVSAEQQKDLRGLLDSLTDDKARTALIAQLRALLAAQEAQQANPTRRKFRRSRQRTR